MRTLEDVMAYLRESRSRFWECYGVRRIGVFGSVARGEATENSDLDVLVDMVDPSFDHYMDLKFEIEDALGMEVDLVLAETAKERIRPALEREVAYA